MPLPDRAARLLPLAKAIGALVGLDPLLILAVCDRESLCGDALRPPGPGGTGDGGHGRGLMQIDDRSHMAFLAAQDWRGRDIWKDPNFNMLYGATLLRANLNALGGDVAGALCAYNAGLGRARRVLQSLPPDAPLEERVSALDAVTANNAYVSSTLARRDAFAAV